MLPKVRGTGNPCVLEKVTGTAAGGRGEHRVRRYVHSNGASDTRGLDMLRLNYNKC